MKKVSCAVICCVVVLTTLQVVSAQVQGQWVSTGSMQSAREFNSQVKIAGGKVLTIGGVDNSGDILPSAEVFSPRSGKWASTGSMAEARESFTAVVLAGGELLVAGGLGIRSGVLASAGLYDPT